MLTLLQRWKEPPTSIADPMNKVTPAAMEHPRFYIPNEGIIIRVTDNLKNIFIKDLLHNLDLCFVDFGR